MSRSRFRIANATVSARFIDRETTSEDTAADYCWSEISGRVAETIP